MYSAFYSLEKKPFTMTPDPSFLYLTKQHREALAGLTYAILDRKGFLVLSGMAGAGKTTLLAWVLQKLPSDRVHPSVILNPTLTREEFIELAMLDFGIAEVPASKAQRLWKLQKYLLECREEGKVNVLIVDEAHKLSYEILEEIRLLGNMEYGDEKLLQILLLGQSELDDVLNRPDLWQLKQRISVRLSIGPLSPDEVEYYIQHRWTLAGGKAHPFTPEAIAHLQKWSQAIPRLINSLCDNALTIAFAEQSRSVTAAHVDSAAEDLRLIEKKPATHASLIASVAPPLHSGPAPVIATAPPVHSAPAPVTANPTPPPKMPTPPISIDRAAASAVATAAPSSAASPSNGHSAAKPAASLKALEQYEPQPKASVWVRLVEKLGLSSNGRA